LLLAVRIREGSKLLQVKQLMPVSYCCVRSETGPFEFLRSQIWISGDLSLSELSAICVAISGFHQIEIFCRLS